MRQPKRIIATLDACIEAGELLKQAGFVVVNVSMQTEAVYYRFPGRPGVLRVADHSGGQAVGLDRVLARLTFLPHRLCRVPGTMVVGEAALHGMVAGAIGRYLIASNKAVLPTYHGARAREAIAPHHAMTALQREAGR